MSLCKHHADYTVGVPIKSVHKPSFSGFIALLSAALKIRCVSVGRERLISVLPDPIVTPARLERRCKLKLCRLSGCHRCLINPAVGNESRCLGCNLGSMAYALVKNGCG
jgi:hypothetical protein